MKYLIVILSILHGLLFIANIAMGIHISTVFPKGEGENSLGGIFGAVTCIMTAISALATAYGYDKSKDISDTALNAACHTVLVAGIAYMWVYWILEVMSAS